MTHFRSTMPIPHRLMSRRTPGDSFMKRPTILVLGGLLLVLPAATAQPAKSAVGIVPSTSFAFVTVRVSDLHDVEVLKPIREAIAKIEKSEGSLEKMLGVPLDEIDRLTFFWPAAPANGGDTTPYIVVTTKDNYNQASVLKALEAVPSAAIRDRRRGAFGAGLAAPPAAKAIDFPPALPKSPPGVGAPIPPPPPPPPPKGPPKGFPGQGASWSAAGQRSTARASETCW